MSGESWDADHIPKSNWMQFETVGDKIAGTLIQVFGKPAKGIFAAQIVYELKRVSINDKDENPDATWYVGIRETNNFVHNRLSKAKIGQRIGVKYVSDFDTGRPGQNPAKSLTPYVWEMDPEYSGPAEPTF